MPETANPTGYGRRPTDGPEVSEAEIMRRQRDALNRTNNGRIEGGKKKPFITVEESMK